MFVPTTSGRSSGSYARTSGGQIRLLERVPLWYVTPLAVGSALVVIHAVLSGEGGGVPLSGSDRPAAFEHHREP